MAANDEKIPITVRTPNELYQRFHQKTEELGQKHTPVILKLMRMYVDGKITLEDSVILRRKI